MIELKPKQVKIVHRPPNLPCVYFQVPLSADLNDIKALEGKTLDGYILTVKKAKKKSLTANAYMWQLCEKIARKIGATKDDVYRMAVREVGAFYDMVIRSEDAEAAASVWGSKGIGWFAESHYESNGTTVLRFYQGSSVYDTEQMRRLIDYVVSEAKSLNIETMSTTEIERLKQLWQQTDT